MPPTPTPDEQTPLFSNGAEPVRAESSRWAKLRSWLWQNAVVIALSILLFVALVFVLLFGLTRHHKGNTPTPSPAPSPAPPSESGTPICTGSGCVLAAATLLKSLSPKYKELDPCDDFRTYTCEGFDALHEIREDQTSVGSLFLMSEDNQLILKRILESPAPSKTSLFWTASNPDKVIHDKLSDAYQACINETELKNIGSKPLLDLLFQIEDAYPTKKPKRSDTSLTDVSYLLDTIGVNGVVGFGVSADDKDPDANIISFGGPWSFGLPSKEYYNNSEIVSTYKDTIGAVLEALLKEAYPNGTTMSVFRTMDQPTVLNKTLVDDLIKFEASLASASPDPEDASDVTKYYNPRTVKQAQKYIPEVSISTIINSFTGGYEPSKIIVRSPDYLQSLSAILKSQSREVIQAFFVWKTVQAWGGSVEDDALQPLLRFRNKLQGKAPDIKGERWRTCVSTVGSDLGKLDLISQTPSSSSMNTRVSFK
jgi:endothelin-converting enzyme